MKKSFETATAVNAKYKEAERLTDFDGAVGHAFADMVRIGIGWISVTRNGDPFKYPYRVKHVPWREMWWDWRARDFNLQDARYVIRRQWYDADDLAMHFPQHRQMIKYASVGWPTGWIDVWDRYGASSEGSLDLGRDNDLARSRHTEENSSLEEREWRDPQRGRLGAVRNSLQGPAPHQGYPHAVWQGHRVPQEQPGPRNGPAERLPANRRAVDALSAGLLSRAAQTRRPRARD